MGIPSYFALLQKKHPRCVTSVPPTVAEAPVLYVDYNCMVHRCVLGDRTDAEIVDAALAYLGDVVRLVNPSRVFVATDGVPPVAKMAQQRKRRFLAKKDAGGGWDRNRITPGTAFMDDLNERTERYLDEMDVQTVYSGSDKPGEGEQKITAAIRAAPRSEIPFVYGLDADLIILSMILKIQGHNPPVLCREKGNPGEDDTLMYVDTDKLVDETASGDVETNVTNHVVCSFFCGNDFTAPLSYMSVRDGWHDKLTTICKELEIRLVRPGTCDVDWDGLLRLLTHLVPSEDREFAKADASFWKARAPPNPDRPADFYPLDNKDPRDRRIRPGTPGWRNRYYRRAILSDHASDIYRCSYEYAVGIQWTLDYYFTGLHTDWHYAFPYGPTLADLHMALSSGDRDPTVDARSRGTSTVHPHQLLAAIMPVFNRDLVPADMARYMSEPDLGHVHMYPESCEMTTYLKRRAWDCSPRMPPLRVPSLLP